MLKRMRAMLTKNMKSQRGFTLLEMLLVVALIAILASIVILAINPGKQLAEARNAQRRSDVNTILNAVYQYSIDNNGTLPSAIPTTSGVTICQSNAFDCSGLIELPELTENQSYLTDIPHDPNSACLTANTCYEIYKSANGRVTVEATQAELGAEILVTR